MPMDLMTTLWGIVGSILAAAVVLVVGVAWRAIQRPEPSFCPDQLRGNERQ